MGKKQTGFTIVELAIVIVVIAILASITVVAYTEVRNKSYDTTIQGDMKNIAAALKSYRARTGIYPEAEADIAAMDSVPGVNPRVNRSAYDVTSPSDPNVDSTSRNLLICKREGVADTPDPKFGIAALSKSGRVWFYTSDDGLTESPDEWRGYQSVTCPRMGINLSDDGYARWFGYQRPESQTDTSSGWRGWTAE